MICRYASLYAYAEQKRLYNIIQVPESKPRSRVVVPFKDKDRDNRWKVRKILEKLHELDDLLTARSIRGRHYDYYSEFAYIKEVVSFLDLPGHKFIVVPVPPKDTIEGATAKRGTRLLFARWGLAHMVLDPFFRFNREKVSTKHRHLYSFLTEREKCLFNDMPPFQSDFDFAKRGDLRILLAAPNERYTVEEKTGFFRGLAGKVRLDEENGLLIERCRENRVDILLLPELMMTWSIQGSLGKRLASRVPSDDGYYYPWLTVAGSRHIRQKSEGVVKWKNRSTVLGPMGKPLYYHDKLCPFEREDKNRRGKWICEPIVSGKSLLALDIPQVGRLLLLICKDYVDIACHIPGQLSVIWPTLFLVPAFSPQLEQFRRGALDLRTKLRAATVIRNSYQALKFFRGPVSLPDLVHVVHNNQIDGARQGAEETRVVTPEPLPADDSAFWSDLYLVRL